MHVLGDVDAVDGDVVDESVDVDVHHPGVRDRHVCQVHVAKGRLAEVDPPEHRVAEILSLELLRHQRLHARGMTVIAPR